MATITNEINSITNDSRGEDVRDSLVSACKKIAVEKLPDVTEVEQGYILTVSSAGVWEALEWI